jgi:hypothetical protein
VRLGGVLFLEAESQEGKEAAFIELENAYTCTRSQLHTTWVEFDYLVRGLAWIKPVAELYLEVALAIAGGAASAVARKAGRTVFRIGLKAAVKHAARRGFMRSAMGFLLRESMRNTATALEAYVSTFVKTVAEDLRDVPLAKLAREQDRDAALRKERCVATAHTKAFGAFVSTLITATLAPRLNKAFDRAQMSELMRFAMLRLTKPLTVGQATLFVKAVTAAAAKSLREPDRFAQHLAQAMAEEVKGLGKSMIEIDWAALGEQFVTQ